MIRYIFIIVINLIEFDLYSNGLIGLSGHVVFSESYEKISDIRINIISNDLSVDTTIFTDKSGFYKIFLPTKAYTLTFGNDSVVGVSSIDLKKTEVKNLMVYYNIQNDYKIFRTGFQQIFTSNNSEILGLKSNGEFRRTIFVGIYAAYSFIENGFYEVKGDTIITKVQSINCYNNMNMDLIGHIDYYIKSSNAPNYLIDKSKNKYELIEFNELEKTYNKK